MRGVDIPTTLIRRFAPPSPARAGEGSANPDPINPHRRVVQDRSLLLRRQRFRGLAIGVDKRVVARPELFDREIRAEQAAIRAEYRDGLVHDLGDMRGVVAMQERAEAGELADDIRARRQPNHAGAPFGSPRRREILEHPCVLQDERHFRDRLRRDRRRRAFAARTPADRSSSRNRRAARHCAGSSGRSRDRAAPRTGKAGSRASAIACGRREPARSAPVDRIAGARPRALKSA